MKRLLVLFLLSCVAAPITAQAECPYSVIDPYPNGLYASQMLAFKPGYWIQTRGPMAKGWRKMKRKRKLHHTRRMYPDKRVLGCPKPTLDTSLTLGHEGFVIVGPAKCFKNGKGPDIIIHEPRSEMNLNETFNVYVTPDKNGIGPWYQIAAKAAVSNANNYFELELDGVVNERGYPITEFAWIKIQDANSQLVMSHERYSGFEVSAVKFMHQCGIPMS